MTKQEFYTFILERVKAKKKRVQKGLLMVFIAVAVAIFMLNFFSLNKAFIDSIIIAVVISLIHIFLGVIIWIPLITSINNEEHSIDRLKKEYYEKFGETWYE